MDFQYLHDDSFRLSPLFPLEDTDLNALPNIDRGIAMPEESPLPGLFAQTNESQYSVIQTSSGSVPLDQLLQAAGTVVRSSPSRHFTTGVSARDSRSRGRPRMPRA